jgi:hypothetical protein
MYDEVIAAAQLVKSSAENKPVSDHFFFCVITDKVTIIRDLGSEHQDELI